MKTITQVHKYLGIVMLLMFSISLFGQTKSYEIGKKAAVDGMEETPDICNMQNVDKSFIYKLTNSTQDPGQKDIDQSFWFRGLFCGNKVVRLSFDETRTGYAYKVLSGDQAGNIHVTGTAFVSEGGMSCNTDFSDSEWNIDMWFRPLNDGESAVPKSPNHFDPDPTEDDIKDWVYYKMISGSVTNANDASMVATLMSMPNSNYGFQIGNGANDMNMDFGGSYWFDYTSVNFPDADNDRKRRGDINVNMDEVNCPPGGEPIEPCTNYAAFYVDQPKGNGPKSLNGVSFAGGIATFTELAVLDFNGHVSYDPISEQIYINNANGKEINTYDKLGNYKSTIVLSGEKALSGVINNVYYNGNVYLGSGSQNRIVKVDLATGKFEDYATKLNISGGDIVVRDGQFFLATRSGRKLYKVFADVNGSPVAAELVGKTVAKVNGIALGPDNDNFIITNSGQNEVFVINPSDASTVVAYKAMKNGASFELFNGDLASACADNPGGGDPDDCGSYVAYYANHDGDDISEIYSVDFDSNNATFTSIAKRDYEVHLAFNSDDGYIYSINADTAELERIDPEFGTGQSISLSAAGDEGPLNKVTAITFFNGQLYIGSDTNDKIYVTSFIDETVVAATYEAIEGTYPVQGGDLVHRNNSLYLATRTNNELLLIAGGSSSFAGNVATKVTGIALSEDNGFLTTNFDSEYIFKLDASGSPAGQYKVMGALSVLRNGDFASGCADAGGGDPFCSEITLANPGAEALQTGKRFVQYFADEEPAGFGWKTTTSIEVQKSGEVDGVVSKEGEYHFELLSRQENDNMYQEISTIPGVPLYLSFYYKKRPGKMPTDTMEAFASSQLEGIDMPANSIGTSTAFEGEDWKLVVFEFTPTTTSTFVMLQGKTGSTQSIGNLIDNISVSCDKPFVKEYRATKSADPGQMVGFNNLRLFPVPAKSNLNIKVSDINKSAVGTYKIMSMTGRTTHQGSITLTEGDNTITEDVSNLPIGMYFLVMEVEGKQISKQFAKVSN